MKITVAQSLEWLGVLTAIAYSLFVASNTGLEFLGFALLLISAFSIGLWAYLGGIVAFYCCSFSMRLPESSACYGGFYTPSEWLLHRKLAVSGLLTVAFVTRRLALFLCVPVL